MGLTPRERVWAQGWALGPRSAPELASWDSASRCSVESSLVPTVAAGYEPTPVAGAQPTGAQVIWTSATSALFADGRPPLSQEEPLYCSRGTQQGGQATLATGPKPCDPLPLALLPNLGKMLTR